LESFGRIETAYQEDQSDEDRITKRNFEFRDRTQLDQYVGFLDRYYGQERQVESASSTAGSVVVIGSSASSATNMTVSTVSNDILNLSSKNYVATSDLLDAISIRFTAITAPDGEGFYTAYFYYRTVNGGEVQIRGNYPYSPDSTVRRNANITLPDTRGGWNLYRFPLYLYDDADFTNQLYIQVQTVAGLAQEVDVSNVYLQKGYGSSVLPAAATGYYALAPMTYAGTAVPAAGDWRAGTYVRNIAPAVGSPKGWYCTVSGTPGTWVSEGNL
jgi:hypothetical protein